MLSLQRTAMLLSYVVLVVYFRLLKVYITIV